MKRLLQFTLALLLAAPAWGAISTPTWEAVAAVSCAGTCADTVTVPATTNGVVSVILMVRSNGGAAHSAVTCSLGGESLTLVTDSDTTSTGSTTVNIYEGLQSLLTTIGTGSKTLQCDNAAGANDVRSIAGHVVFLNGAAQQTAEASDGADNSFAATTSLSVSLTVSPGALILMGAAHSADSGPPTVVADLRAAACQAAGSVGAGAAGHEGIAGPTTSEPAGIVLRDQAQQVRHHQREQHAKGGRQQPAGFALGAYAVSSSNSYGILQ